MGMTAGNAKQSCPRCESDLDPGELVNESRFMEGTFQRPVPNSKADLREKGMIANSKKHPGFNNVAKSIASKEGLPLDRARAIAAGAARNASKAAKKANPHLKRVKG